MSKLGENLARNPEDPSETPGVLLAIMGLSGSGKTTLARRLKERLPQVEIVTLSTTRPPRPGEIRGVDMNFVSQEELEARRKEGEFLHVARFGNAIYATPNMIDDVLAGKDTIWVPPIETFINILDFFESQASARFGRYNAQLLQRSLTPVLIEVPRAEAKRRFLEREGNKTPRDFGERERINAALLHQYRDYFTHVVSNETGQLDRAVEELVIIYLNKSKELAEDPKVQELLKGREGADPAARINLRYYRPRHHFPPEEPIDIPPSIERPKPFTIKPYRDLSPASQEMLAKNRKSVSINKDGVPDPYWDTVITEQGTLSRWMLIDGENELGETSTYEGKEAVVTLPFYIDADGTIRIVTILEPRYTLEGLEQGHEMLIETFPKGHIPEGQPPDVAGMFEILEEAGFHPTGSRYPLRGVNLDYGRGSRLTHFFALEVQPPTGNERPRPNKNERIYTGNQRTLEEIIDLMDYSMDGLTLTGSALAVRFITKHFPQKPKEKESTQTGKEIEIFTLPAKEED